MKQGAPVHEHNADKAVLVVRVAEVVVLHPGKT